MAGTGTKVNNNFGLAQKKPLDERLASVLTVDDLTLIRYPYPNMRIYVGGDVNKWYEYKLTLGVYGWKADGVSARSYLDLGDRPTINNHAIEGDVSLDDLGIQPKGKYLTDLYLGDYYKKDETFSTTEIIESFAQKSSLDSKVDKIAGSTLLTTIQATKLAGDVTPVMLDTAKALLVKKNTSELLSIAEFHSASPEFIRLYNESTGVEYKMSLATLYNLVSQVLIAKPLIGEKEKRDTFTCDEFISGSTAVYVNGLKYFLGQGFMEIGKNSIQFNSYIPEPSDTLMIEAIWVNV